MTAARALSERILDLATTPKSVPNGNYIRVEEAAICPDCSVIFSVRHKACPTCGGDGWALLEKREERHP